jgi:hypothetical protein
MRREGPILGGFGFLLNHVCSTGLDYAHGDHMLGSLMRKVAFLYLSAYLPFILFCTRLLNLDQVNSIPLFLTAVLCSRALGISSIPNYLTRLRVGSLQGALNSLALAKFLLQRPNADFRKGSFMRWGFSMQGGVKQNPRRIVLDTAMKCRA